MLGGLQLRTWFNVVFCGTQDGLLYVVISGAIRFVIGISALNLEELWDEQRVKKWVEPEGTGVGAV